MNSRKVRYSCLLVCLTALLGSSWPAPAVAGDVVDLRLAAGPILGGAGEPALPLRSQSPQVKPLVGVVEVNPLQPPAMSVLPKTAGSGLVPAKGRLIKVEGLTRQQIDLLQIQNSDVVEYKGKQYEVGTLRTQVQKVEAAALATMKQKATEAQGKFDAYRADFAKGQLSNLAAANAKVNTLARKLLGKTQASGGKAPPPSRPTITEISAADLTPGGRVLIVGSGFGGSTGTVPPGSVTLNIVKVTGSKTQPGGVSSPVSYPVAIESWKDTAIIGTIPADIAGSPDVSGTLVVDAGGTRSNLWPVKFIAAREVLLMNCASQLTDYLVYCGSSGSTPGYHVCYCRNYTQPASTFWGGHIGWIDSYAAKGNDVYKVSSLANGWTFVTATTGWTGSGSATLNGFKPSSSSQNLVVEWNYDVSWVGPIPVPGMVDYAVYLYMAGPKGVPYF
jgi:hypothetical protein